MSSNRCSDAVPDPSQPARWQLLALVLLLLAGCAPASRGFEAALLLEDVAAAGDESRLKTRTAKPAREEIRYRIGERHYVADIYRSASPPRAALILMHGFSEHGKNDPRLRQFAESLSRSGFNVLVPDIESLRKFRVSPEDSRYVSDAVRFLSARPELAPERRIGAGAFSYAVGPLMLAALEPDTAPRVRFILAVGGYYDIVDAITFITTGYHHIGGRREYRRPDAVARWLFLSSYLYRLDDADDRATLERIALLKAENPGADVAELAAQLGPQGRVVFDLLTNTNPDRVVPLIAQLPEPIRADLQALNLANKDFSALRARLLLVHGVDDAVIPAAHSEALAAALPPWQRSLYLVGGLYHVDIEPTLADKWRLWRAAQHLLWLRDEG